MKSSLYTLAFATALGCTCALCLTAAGSFTKKYRDANREAERVRNIFSVLDVPFDPDASSEDLVAMFKERITVRVVGKVPNELELNYFTDADGNERIAVPFSGPGLWGPVRGFLSLESDMRTVRGITFHEQEETPGLGGEIAAKCSHAEGDDRQKCGAKFRHQFEGKKIVGADGKLGILMMRGDASAQNEVDAITGATMTSDKVAAMLQKVIEKIVSVERGDMDGN
jgi:Na+-transporting NADH:ubiquinone oxidoreductase subunit C